jgi:methyl-accepting chemotaxis protein
MAANRQAHTFDMEKAQSELAEKVEETLVGRESQALAALVEMTSRQSEAQIELTKEALAALNIMSSNVAELSVTIRGVAQDSEAKLASLEKLILELCNRMDNVGEKLDGSIHATQETEQRMKDLLRAMVSSSSNVAPQVQEAASKL